MGFVPKIPCEILFAFERGFSLWDLIPKSRQLVFNPKYTSQNTYSKTVHFCTSIPNPNPKVKLMLNTSKNLAGFDAGFAVLDLRAKTGSKSAKVFDPLKLLIHCSSEHKSLPILVFLFTSETLFLDIRMAFDRASASLQVFESTANAMAQAALNYRSDLYQALRISYNAIRNEGADTLKGIVFQDPDILVELKIVLDMFNDPKPSVAKPPGGFLFFFP